MTRRQAGRTRTRTGATATSLRADAEAGAGGRPTGEGATDSTLVADLSAALVVVLISLPLAMGIALASGLPPALGLWTAAIGGLVTGSLSGCPLQISGPSAGLAVMVMDVVNQHGARALWVVVPTAGLLQILAGRLRLGQFFRAVSPAVIRGMLAGIGVLILASQFHVMVDEGVKESGLQNLLTIPAAIYKATVPQPGASHRAAAVIGLLTLGVILLVGLFRRYLPRNFQAPLVAVVTATVVAEVMGLDIKRVTLGGNPFLDLHLPDWAALQSFLRPEVFLNGAAIGFVASAETLLCSTAVDQMHSGARTDYDQELFAQGVGNLFCGVVGAGPASGVITRSTANVEAGARTRRAAVASGAMLVALVSLLPSVLERIPTASLAGVLVYVGYRLVRTTPLETLRRYGSSEVAIYGVTLSSIVTTNLLQGLMIGLGLAVAKLLYTFSHLQVRVSRSAPDQTHVHLVGSATFVRLPQLAQELDAVPAQGVIHVHIQELDYIDHACLDLLASWEERVGREGGRAFIEWEELTGKYHQRNRLVDPAASNFLQGELRMPAIFDQAVDEAEVLELEEGVGFEEALVRLARTLAPRTGHDPEELLDLLMERSSHCVCVRLQGMAVPHLHVPKLDAPVVALARSREGLTAPCEPAPERNHGLFVLASPEGDAAQHLHMLSQLARRIGDPAFSERWLAVRTAKDLRDCLLFRQHLLAVPVTADEQTSPLIGQRVYEFSRREDCVVSLVIRDGHPLMPHAGTRIQEGDQLILVGGARCIGSARQRYGLESDPLAKPDPT